MHVRAEERRVEGGAGRLVEHCLGQRVALAEAALYQAALAGLAVKLLVVARRRRRDGLRRWRQVVGREGRFEEVLPLLFFISFQSPRFGITHPTWVAERRLTIGNSPACIAVQR